jgi:glutathione S-transferase
MVAVPWWFLGMSGEGDNPLAPWVEKRLGQFERILAAREWLAAGRFTVADLLMADVLRVPKVRELGGRPASEAYVARLTGRPAFKAAYDEQIAQFAAADSQRTATER